MKYWIEVSSGDWAWTSKLSPNIYGYKRGLKAPAKTRYYNFLKGVGKGDLILSYLTASLTSKKEWRSAIIGVSIAVGPMYTRNNSIFVDTYEDTEIPKPISLNDFKNREDLSPKFKKLLMRNMQKYLSEIEKKDVDIIFQIYPENWEFIKEFFIRNSINETLSHP